MFPAISLIRKSNAASNCWLFVNGFNFTMQLGVNQSMTTLFPRDKFNDISRPLPSHQLVVDEIATADIYALGVGAFAPLTGFMDEVTYDMVCHEMRLPNGLIWPVPVTLSVSELDACCLKEGMDILLKGIDHTLYAILHLTSIYRPNREQEADLVYGTHDPHHPGVKRLLQRGPVYLGGDLDVLHIPRFPLIDQPFMRVMTPSQVRSHIKSRGWQTVAGFQTRNPIHRAHEYIQKCALEIVDALFIHPLVGPTKADDVPSSVRIKTYEVLLEHYYPPDRVLFSVYYAAMRYAGPREAVFHALVRKNYGCTHFIVGRDHAGVGNYYGPYDAHKIFNRFSPKELGVTPLFFEQAFYCRRCDGMATSKTCPHAPEHHVYLSGTQVRTMLRKGEDLPKEFSRPEVAEILKHYYRG